LGSRPYQESAWLCLGPLPLSLLPTCLAVAIGLRIRKEKREPNRKNPMNARPGPQRTSQTSYIQNIAHHPRWISQKKSPADPYGADRKRFRLDLGCCPTPRFILAREGARRIGKTRLRKAIR